MRFAFVLFLCLLVSNACGGAPEPAAEADESERVTPAGGGGSASDEGGGATRRTSVGPSAEIAMGLGGEQPAQSVRGMIRGPFTVTGACGACEAQLRLITGDGYEHPFVHDESLAEAVQRCVDIGAVTEIVGRFVDGPGACDEGQCRYFHAESFPAECEAPNEEQTTFASGSYAQCLGTTLQASECHKLGPECSLLARIQHPCANSGALCTPERERAQGPATRPCECTCSPEYRRWQRQLEANRPSQPRP